MSDPVRLALAEVHALALQVLRAHGVSEAHARAIADTITAAERDDCQAHGLFRLAGYVRSVRSGKRDNHDGGPPGGGEFTIAIDPVRCVGHGHRQQQLAHAEQLFANILAQEGTRLPSDRRYAARQRTPREGITIPRALYEALQHAGERRDPHGSNS
jgi:LDH2 family malate/lactate/ureidoglycolate dehydrogenase